MRRVLDRSISTFAAVALTSVSIILALTLYRLTVIEPALTRSGDAQVRLSQNLEGMLDQETALRAYVIVHQALFLEPDSPGRSETQTAMNALAGDLSGKPAELRSLVGLSAAEQAWESGWAEPARALITGPDLDSFLAQGKTLFDAYRDAQTDMGAMVSADFNDNITLSERLALVSLAVAVASLLAKLIAWLSARRRLRRDVFTPVSQLITTFDLLAEGRLDVEAPVAGPQEFRLIGAGVNRVLATLRDDRDQLLQNDLDKTLANERLTQLVETARHIAGSLSLRYVLNAVGESAVSLGAARAVLWLVDGDQQLVRAVYDSGGPHGRATGIEPVEIGSGLVGRAARYGRWITGTDDPAGDTPVNACALPMIVGARVVGVIEALCADAVDEFSPQVLEVLDTLASQAATAVEAARLYEEVDERSRTDPLTGLGNRTALNAAMGQAIAHAGRYRRPLSVAMIDVDHFKQYNDRHGHQAGDDALQELAALLQHQVRESDSVYRFGGEEIVVLLPETDIDGAVSLMDRVRGAVEERFAGIASRDRVTISVGVRAFPTHAVTARTLIETADAALYLSKAKGRNAVTAATPESELSTPARSSALP